MLMRIYIQISVFGSYEPNISTVQYSTVLNKSNDPLTSQYFITCFNKIKNKYMNSSGSKKKSGSVMMLLILRDPDLHDTASVL